MDRIEKLIRPPGVVVKLRLGVGNDGAREDCGKEKVCLPSYTLEDASRAHSGMCIECAGKAA